MILIFLLLATSIIGTIGLSRAHPRPGDQECWAILAMAPIFVLLVYALFGGVWHG